MSTRSVIARKTETGFSGRYHHWDGYPEGLGATLFQLRNGHFKKDTKAMLKTLIDDHPAGWSTIVNADFGIEPGFAGTMSEEAGKRPQCYCHGSRHEQAGEITEKTASGSGCEWAYVFDPTGSTMEIQSSYCDLSREGVGGDKMIGACGCGDDRAIWLTVATIDLNGTEPDWKSIQEKAYPCNA